jgi:hypothetical protein
MQVTTHGAKRNAGVIDVTIGVDPRKQPGVTVEVLALQDVLQFLNGAVDAQPLAPFQVEDVVHQSHIGCMGEQLIRG